MQDDGILYQKILGNGELNRNETLSPSLAH